MKNDAYSFASEVDSSIEALSKKELLRKIGRSKRLQEELYPLSRLGLHFKQHGLDVEVEGFENSGRPDGFIRITGFIEREFEVQVTFAGFGYKEALRRELLSTNGYAPGAGPIQRNLNGEIDATMASVHFDEHIGRVATAVNKCFANKLSRTYADGTVLLIAFYETSLFGRENWRLLFSKLEHDGGLAGSSFAEIYLFNCASNELHKAA